LTIPHENLVENSPKLCFERCFATKVSTNIPNWLDTYK